MSPLIDTISKAKNLRCSHLGQVRPPRHSRSSLLIVAQGKLAFRWGYEDPLRRTSPVPQPPPTPMPTPSPSRTPISAPGSSPPSVTPASDTPAPMAVEVPRSITRKLITNPRGINPDRPPGRRPCAPISNGVCKKRHRQPSTKRPPSNRRTSPRPPSQARTPSSPGKPTPPPDQVRGERSSSCGHKV